MGLTRGVTTTTGKLEKTWAEGVQGHNGGKATDSEQPGWDEHDVMLFFWGNSKRSMERHAEKEREREKNISSWRAGIS
jgi:hypothetical protein